MYSIDIYRTDDAILIHDKPGGWKSKWALAGFLFAGAVLVFTTLVGIAAYYEQLEQNAPLPNETFVNFMSGLFFVLMAFSSVFFFFLSLSHRFKTFLAIAAVFAVFFLFGAWMTPDVNETHYIGKAINYWQPDWIQDDPFLNSRDAHWTFYLVFGWLSFVCSPTAMAWSGRIVAWTLLAWSWQRLSYALIPVRWVAIPTALAQAYYIESFNMAGEWLIGGIEGKSLAYPFVFFALEAMLRRRWNRAGIFLGVATALHVLVGGWATLIAGILFFVSGDWRRRRQTADGRRQQRLYVPFVGIIVGGATALCGLLPVLMLNSGVSAEVISKANQIYVFERLPHHLVPYLIKESFMLRFALLTVIWIVLCRNLGGGRRQRIFNGFVWGTLGLTAIGMILAYSLSGNKELSAAIMRFYWFRLSDIAVPMGVAIGATRYFVQTADVRRLTADLAGTPVSLQKVLTLCVVIAAIYFTATYLCFVHFGMTPPDQTVPWAITLLICWGLSLLPSAVCRLPSLTLFYIAIAFYAPLTVLPKYVDLRTHGAFCRSEPDGTTGKKAGAAAEWQDMCQWVKENTPKTAKFWIPRDEYTFHWHAQRAALGTRKNIPQDAAAIVEWRKSMDDLFRYKNAEGATMTDRLLTSLLNNKTDEQIVELRQHYGFDYIICVQFYEMPKHATLERVYENDVYCLYRVLP